MKLFPWRKTRYENVRKAKKVKTKINVQWFKPLLGMMMFGVIVGGLMLGGMKLNEALSVTYWHVEADPALKGKIETFLLQRQERGFWQTRASVIQAALLIQVPDAQQVEVSRVLPDGLRIKAATRQPFALWERKREAESVMLVDAAGFAYRTMERGEAFDLPILRLTKGEVVRAVDLVHQLYAQDKGKVTRLSEVIVIGQQWRFNFAAGEQWVLNHINLKQDLQQIERILAKPRWSQDHWRMDARIPQRWFVRPALQEVI